VYTNPTEVLDSITLTPEILERADAVTRDYDKLIQMNNKRLLGYGEGYVPDGAHRKQIFRTLASVNVLEAVRFYVSFACSFSFAERALMEGNAKIIRMIARDEALHLSGTQLMLQALMYGDEGDLWQQTAAECLDDMFKLFDDAVAQEKNWASYLFKDGSVIGLNSEILCNYVEYIANVRIKALGFDRRYPTTQDPLPWMQSYLVSDNVQVAPQESEITSYVSGAIDMNVGDEAFEGLTL
jgi:ribonucleoside-diphosphate reductase beta chain